MAKPFSSRSLGKQTPAHNKKYLTPRELEVVAHIAMDLSNEQIGSELGISVETVKEHVQNVIRKLKVRSRVGLALWHVKNKTTK